MKYKTVIFDLDGTILNTLDDLADNINLMLRHRGYPERTLGEVRMFVGEGYRKMITRSLPAEVTEEEIDYCVELFRFYYNQNMANKTRPYEGIIPLLQELKDMGIGIGVVSNKMDEATKKTCDYFFGDLIDVAIGDSPPRKRKPEPDNVYEAMRLLGADKDTTLFVGDSHIDIRTAKNAGLISVGVTWGFRTRQVLEREGADFIIDEPGDLLEKIILGGS